MGSRDAALAAEPAIPWVEQAFPDGCELVNPVMECCLDDRSPAAGSDAARKEGFDIRTST